MSLGNSLNNPGNIRKSPTAYKGEVASSNSSFKQFSDMKYGFRAMFSLLYHYINSNGYNTINKIISHYAPASDGNNPDSYTKYVATNSGVPADQTLTTADFYKGPLGANIVNIARQMARVEQGSAPDEQALSDWFDLFIQDQGLA